LSSAERINWQNVQELCVVKDMEGHDRNL